MIGRCLASPGVLMERLRYHRGCLFRFIFAWNLFLSSGLGALAATKPASATDNILDGVVESVEFHDARSPTSYGSWQGSTIST